MGIMRRIEEDLEGSFCERDNPKLSSPMEKFHLVLRVFSFPTGTSHN